MQVHGSDLWPTCMNVSGVQPRLNEIHRGQGTAAKMGAADRLLKLPILCCLSLNNLGALVAIRCFVGLVRENGLVLPA